MESTVPTGATLNSSPPPSSSRLPPDGHEFPPDYQEPCPDQLDFGKPSEIVESDIKMQPPPPALPSSAQPTITKRFRSNSVDDHDNFGKFSMPVLDDISVKTPIRAAGWRNDEKSEKSVRDKIAMFSNVNDESPVSPCHQPAAIRKLNRFKSSEDVFSGMERSESPNPLPSVRTLSRSVMSVDKVASSIQQESDDRSSRPPMKKGSSTYNSMVDVTEKQIKMPSSNPLDFVNRAQSSVDLLLSSDCSSSAYSSCSPESSLSPTVSPSYVGYSSTLPRKHQTPRKTSVSSTQPPSSDSKTGLSRAMSFTVGNKLHSRSQSLIDVTSNKYTPNSLNKLNSEEARRASLNALIEQRRRSMSKLRGLVIPEKVTELPLMQQTIVDLPEIISKDSVLPSKKTISNFSNEPKTRFNSYNKTSSEMCQMNSNNLKQSNTSCNLMISPPWKSESTNVNDLPKYSPAFKRKSLAVYGISSSASSVSSSLSSSREELRPFFDNNNRINGNNNNSSSKSVKSINQRSGANYSITDSYLSPSLHNNNEPPKSLESITSPTRSDFSFEFISSTASSPDVKMMFAQSEQDQVKASQIDYENNNFNVNEPHVTPSIRAMSCGKKYSPNGNCRRSGEESDNDSAVSSSRSSISHDFSPPISPLPDRNDHQRINDDDQSLSPTEHQRLVISPSNSSNSGDRSTLRRTLSSETTASAASSTGSTLTSGSQASCSSSASDNSISRRVLKPQSVEAINRKNVLSSARFSSGQDLKVGSPLIRRKFENTSETESSVDNNNQSNSENYTDVENNNFMNTLNEKLRKDDRLCDIPPCDNADKSVHYRLLSPSSDQIAGDITATKIAYLELEVTDGPESLPNELDSKYSDESSSPASIDGIDFDSSVERKMNYSNSSDEMDNKIISDSETFKDDSLDLLSHSRRDSESTLEENDFSSKPFVKTVTKETNNINSNNSHSNSNNININNNNSSNNNNNSCSNINDINSSNNNVGDNKFNIEEKLKSVKLNDVNVNNCKNNVRLFSQTKGSKSKKDAYSSNSDKCDFYNKDCNKRERMGKTNENGGSIPVPIRTVIGKKHSVSVNDIRKAFEKTEMTSPSNTTNNRINKPNSSNHLNNSGSLNHIHARVSSLDSTTSEDSCAPTPTHYGSVTNLQKEQQFGSITSLASSTSLISQQELQQLIDDANQTLEETAGLNSSSNHEVLVVILHRDNTGGSVGITLAGGADYEAKEITVHKVLVGSPADRDGRIQKGDRILSINGRSMKGITHRESLAILKAPRPEVVLVVSRWRPEGQQTDSPEDPLVASIRNNLRPPRIPEQPVDLTVDQPVAEKDNTLWSPPVTVSLVKDGAGLGFSLEGGKDSPLGDMPLTIKKIFTGGCAEKSGQLFAGDELLAVNGTDVTTMSRIEAWSLMKRIADGKVKLNLRHRVNNTSAVCT